MTAPDRPGPFSDRELARLLHRANRMMARLYHREDRAPHAQEHVLSLLRTHGPMTQAELLRILEVRSSSLSELLRKLELAGLVARERNPEDRRGFVISATGPEPVAPGPGPAEADALFDCLDSGEREQLGTILAKLAAGLDEEPRGCGMGRGRGQGRGMGQGMGRGRGRGRR